MSAPVDASASGSQGYAARGQPAPSVVDVLADVSRDLSVLVRQELELVKAELKQEAAKAGKGAGLIGGAAFAGYMVLLFLSIAVWWGLEHAIDAAWAAIIVAALWAAIGIVFVAKGRSTLRALNPKPERTVKTVRQIPDALKGH